MIEVIFKKLLYFFCGYLEVTVEGFYIERFLNKCAINNIKVWNLRRDGKCILRCYMKAEDFKRIKDILKVTGSKIKINRKAGLNFKLFKYRKRKVFLIFPVIILILLLFLSSFIWNIEYLGDFNNVDKESIEKVLKENNVKIGVKKKNIDKDVLSNKIRLDNNNISWVGIKIEGTNLKIEIAKAREKPDIIDKDEYCNIVAKEDGIIESINVQSGTARVENGDVVSKGEILVEGVMEGKFTDPRKVHARADIIARTWIEKKEKINKSELLDIETGRKEKYYTISINNFNINFNKRLSNFKKYDTIKNSNRLRVSNNFYLPITYTEVTNIEMKSDFTEESIESAEKKIISKMEEDLDNQCSSLEIVDKKVITEEKNDFIEIKVIYEILDKIGVEEKLE